MHPKCPPVGGGLQPHRRKWPFGISISRPSGRMCAGASLARKEAVTQEEQTASITRGWAPWGQAHCEASVCPRTTIAKRHGRQFVGAPHAAPMQARRMYRPAQFITGRTLSAPFPKYGRTFSTTLQARTTAGWHCWLAQSRGTRDHRFSCGSGTEFAPRSTKGRRLSTGKGRGSSLLFERCTGRAILKDIQERRMTRRVSNDAPYRKTAENTPAAWTRRPDTLMTVS
jgi:hypothetical protein